MLYKERSTAADEVLGMWGSGALYVDLSKKSGAPCTGRSIAKEWREVGVQSVMIRLGQVF